MWGGAPNKYLDKIDKCIKPSMRTMLLKNRFDNVKPFYKHLNPLSANPTKWSNIIVCSNCLSVFDHFMKLALKGLTYFLSLKT